LIWPPSAWSILTAVLVASCVSFVTIPLSGHISDRIGRRKMYLIGAATTGLFGFLYFGMVDTAIPSVVFIAIVLSLIPHDMQYGPQAALIAEAFTPRLRYSGIPAASVDDYSAAFVSGLRFPLTIVEPLRQAENAPNNSSCAIDYDARIELHREQWRYFCKPVGRFAGSL
jgi:MFS family permease